ncbi:hypothetical protein L484_015204 [Morus notabilis]|uniref:Uncharacterized protein n=1 Tax=Morus notabilis TaxID=981085 RepID=W9S391_9ROSA|nr:hypothetical protein L484_015204 [Morus notabilis]
MGFQLGLEEAQKRLWAGSACSACLFLRNLFRPNPRLNSEWKKGEKWGERGSNSRPQDYSEAMRPTR